MQVDKFWSGKQNPFVGVITEAAAHSKWNKHLRNNPVSFKSKFPSVCVGCLNSINVGDYIEYLPGIKTVVHSKDTCVADGLERLKNAPTCPKCQDPLKFLVGKYGAFWACPNNCKSGEGKNITQTIETKPKVGGEKSIIAKISGRCCVCDGQIVKGIDRIQPFDALKGVWIHPACKENGLEMAAAKVNCAACGKQMRLMNGKFGPFWGCTGYPICRTTVKFSKTLEEPRAETPAEVKPSWQEPVEAKVSSWQPPQQEDVLDKPLGSHIIEEVLEVEEEDVLPEILPEPELPKYKYTLWLDPEFTQPYTFIRNGETTHAGGNNLVKVQATVDAIMAKTKVKVYIQTH